MAWPISVDSTSFRGAAARSNCVAVMVSPLATMLVDALQHQTDGGVGFGLNVVLERAKDVFDFQRVNLIFEAAQICHVPAFKSEMNSRRPAGGFGPGSSRSTFAVRVQGVFSSLERCGDAAEVVRHLFQSLLSGYCLPFPLFAVCSLQAVQRSTDRLQLAQILRLATPRLHIVDSVLSLSRHRSSSSKWWVRCRQALLQAMAIHQLVR